MQLLQQHPVVGDDSTFEHVMNVIVSLCNRVLVLHQGRKIADGPVRDVLRDKGVLAAYLGRAFTEEVLDRRAGEDGGAG